MTDVPTSLRLPEDLVRMADALIEKVASDPRVAVHGQVTRATVLRLALVEGLQVLDEQRDWHGRARSYEATARALLESDPHAAKLALHAEGWSPNEDHEDEWVPPDETEIAARGGPRGIGDFKTWFALATALMNRDVRILEAAGWQVTTGSSCPLPSGGCFWWQVGEMRDPAPAKGERRYVSVGVAMKRLMERSKGAAVEPKGVAGKRGAR